MTLYTKLSYLIAFLTLVSLLLSWFYQVSLYFLLIPAGLYFGAVAYGSATIGANFYMRSIVRLHTNKNQIAITFDDGPDPIRTPEILALLNKYDVKATFFIIGKKIHGNEALLKKMHSYGHTLGNHSYEHSYTYDFYSTARIISDLKRFNSHFESLFGVNPKWFRPPYGVTNPSIAKAVKQLGLVSIGWNVRSLDTVIQDKNKLAKRVLSKIMPGSIVLFHDTGTSTLQVLEELILNCRQTGYTIVGLNELLSEKAYE